MKKIIIKNWRRINPYRCLGCGKARLSFSYARAQRDQLCTKCQIKKVDENQAKLF